MTLLHKTEDTAQKLFPGRTIIETNQGRPYTCLALAFVVWGFSILRKILVT